MTGGSVSRSAGILSRANEIERLQAQQKEAAAALDKLRGEQKEAQCTPLPFGRSGIL